MEKIAVHNIAKKIDFVVVILLISVSAVIAYGYFSRVDKPNYGLRFELHSQIIQGTALSPYRYRILVPFLANGLTAIFSVVLSEKAAFLLSYAVYDLLAVFFLLATLFLWLRSWFSREQALIGVLFTAGTIPIALQDHYFQPWSLLEVGLFSAALLAIYRKHYWLLASLVILASLNRETAAFIPLVFLLASLDIKSLFKPSSKMDWMLLLRFICLFLIWAVIFLGLHFLRGSVAHIESIKELLARNMAIGSLFYAFVNSGLFLGGFWVFTVLGFKYAPSFIRRVALIVPLYLLLVIVYGVWYEVRLLTPLYPVFIPLGLSFVFRHDLNTPAT
jgi:hypothetical protein